MSVTLALPALLLALLLTGCGSGGDAGAGGTKPNTRPDERLRQTISKGLVAAGRQEEARIVALSGSRLTPVTAPFLRTWKIYRVDYRQSPHPVLLHVATGGGRVELLTGAPSAFGKVTAADGTTVGDAATAAALARTYVETTRPGGVLTYVVGRVEDIRFRPGITGAAAKHRDEIVSRYRSRIKAPAAVAAGEDFTATVYVVKDKELQKHDIKVSASGAIDDGVDTLVPDLPVPYTL
ncbi:MULTISPECIES: hypothetical protein [Actinomadura]|uniref:Lipoprotein n=2 Tax=Actinomadura madurae TaxID=1993 RepID=A0A1I5DBJ3_9ACTN|nr:hypothetical protein [Actinomadura madurae]SFN96151.1 hypothetical protein SAMN04489713_103558 [Actinomadura madurae]